MAVTWAGTVTQVMAAVIWSTPVLCITFHLFQFYVLPLAQGSGREIDDTPVDEDKLGANTASEHYRCYSI